MEINNRPHSSHGSYLQNQQANSAEQNNVSPSEHIKEEQEDKQKSSQSAALTASKNTEEVSTQAEQIHEAKSLQSLEPINLTLARKQSNTQDNRMQYKVAAHDAQVAHQVAKAINSYHAVENSQYGQELVNRIELMV